MIKECEKCLLNDNIPGIEIDASGLCGFCRHHSLMIANYTYNEEDVLENLAALKSRIKKRRKGQYDALLGLSGGVDSSYLAKLAADLDLNILCIHFDNGWNSKIAIRNISKIIEKTNFDFITHVINWNEFKDLQRSFFYSGVIDIEMLTDHAIFASMYRLARKYKVKTILSGTNFRTEHGMPSAWVWNKMDLKNIKDIHRKFGSKKIKSFPTLSPYRWLLMKQFGFGANFEEPLNLINYEKARAIDELKNYFGWEDYGGKHHESEFTKFYQTYILPTKFGVDKRTVHLSDLIRNNEITKMEGEKELADIEFPLIDEKLKQYVVKKLGFTEEEFDELMLSEAIPHSNYKTDVFTINRLKSIRSKIVGR